MTDSVGAELKRTREELGLSITEVAHHLKLAPRQVEALEEDRFEQLPGVAFVRGVLKTYARYLRLPPEPLLERIAGRFETPDASRLAERYSQQVPFSDSARRSTFAYLGLSIVVLAMGSAVAYQWYREYRGPAELAQAQRVPDEPPPVAAAVPAPRAQPKLVEPVVHSELTTSVAAKQTAEPEVEKHRVDAKPAVEAVVAKVASRTSGVNRLVIRCEEDAWIEVRDGKDRTLVSSLNPKGSERVVRARGPLTLVIGNARHVQVIHNDTPIDLAPYTKLTIARFTLP